MRIERHARPAQCRSCEPFDLELAARGGQRIERGGTDNFPVIAIGHDDAAAIGAICVAFERAAIHPRGQGPEEPVAEIEIIGPFAIAQQVAPLDLDLDDDHLPLSVDPHHVRAPPIAQRHFGEAPDIVARKQPRYAAGDVACRGGCQG